MLLVTNDARESRTVRGLRTVIETDSITVFSYKLRKNVVGTTVHVMVEMVEGMGMCEQYDAVGKFFPGQWAFPFRIDQQLGEF